mmetsp:Transcript_74432/g.172481  ORF Transcript_74432/g.172481 Transcript_74432/m.172481 type:complete len:265 (+) Transcript_74432:455-1249(+)
MHRHLGEPLGSLVLWVTVAMTVGGELACLRRGPQHACRCRRHGSVSPAHARAAVDGDQAPWWEATAQASGGHLQLPTRALEQHRPVGDVGARAHLPTARHRFAPPTTGKDLARLAFDHRRPQRCKAHVVELPILWLHSGTVHQLLSSVPRFSSDFSRRPEPQAPRVVFNSFARVVSPWGGHEIARELAGHLIVDGGERAEGRDASFGISWASESQEIPDGLPHFCSLQCAIKPKLCKQEKELSVTNFWEVVKLQVFLPQPGIEA